MDDRARTIAAVVIGVALGAAILGFVLAAW